MAEAKAKTVIIENVSRRLHIIDGRNLAPTQADTFPASVLEQGGVKIAFDMNELKVAEEVKEPITEEKDAEKELARRKAERAGNTNANGTPAPKTNAGK